MLAAGIAHGMAIGQPPGDDDIRHDREAVHHAAAMTSKLLGGEVMLRDWETDAQRLVHRHWAEIAAVAAALETTDELNESGIDSIIAAARLYSGDLAADCRQIHPAHGGDK
jgi:hypothetical protein